MWSETGVAHLHGYTVDVENYQRRKFSFTLHPPEKKMRVFCFSADSEIDKKRFDMSFILSFFVFVFVFFVLMFWTCYIYMCLHSIFIFVDFLKTVNKLWPWKSLLMVKNDLVCVYPWQVCPWVSLPRNKQYPRKSSLWQGML